MRPHSIVMAPPALDDDLGFAKRVEDFAVEKLVAQASIEALDVAILPWTAPLDVSGLGADRSDPVLHCLGDELGTIVRPDMARDASHNEEIGQGVDHVDRLELAVDSNCQALVTELVDDREHAQSTAIMGAVLDEVIGPDVIGPLWPQADARSIREP